jgi:hypothetical protein
MSAKQPGEGSPPAGDSGSYSQEIQHNQVSARVPEKVSRGVFSTGVLVLQGGFEFVLDFVLRMNQPQQIVARVALPLNLMPGLINALRENLALYQKQFGPPPQMPVPQPPPKPPSIEEIYEQLKLPDDTLSGVYANHALITHSPGEFCIEFITNFYPRSAVSCRVFLAVPQVPVMLNTLNLAWQQYQQRIAAAQQQQQPRLPPGQQPGHG